MVTVLRILVWLMAALPRGAALAVGRGLGRLFGRLARRQRERARENLQRAFPNWDETQRRGTARRMFANFGANQIEIMRWMGGRRAEVESGVVFGLDDVIQDQFAKGRGLLVLTAHLGNWDLMGLWAASRYPLTIISKDLRNEGLNRFWMEQRAKAGLKIVPAHNSYRDCLRVLKRNEALGFILDQNMTREEGLFVEFFGRPACTTPGLAVMSAHSGAPVLPLFLLKGPDGRYEMVAGSPIDPPPDRKPETIHAFTQHYTRILEDAVRAHPDQWIWMHRRWRTQPPSGPGAG